MIQTLLPIKRAQCSGQAGARRLHGRTVSFRGRTGNHSGAGLKLAAGSSCGAAPAGSFSRCCDAKLLYMLTARGAKSTCTRGTGCVTDRSAGLPG